MIIGIGFDGTCVTDEFPKIGQEIGSVDILKKLTDTGHQLILFTIRSNIDNPESENNKIHLKSGTYLTDAVKWFKKHKIPLYGIQTNPTQKTWTTSPKAYCELYIDNAALGCPLKYNKYISSKAFVDWEKIEKLLKEEYLLL